MKIGDFAKLCGTNISVLRHYDKLGLLNPVYVDAFTEYRYYDRSQAEIFLSIRRLKNAGFTLAEIKLLLGESETKEKSEMFERKKAKLLQMLHSLEELKTDFMPTDTCDSAGVSSGQKGGKVMEPKVKCFIEKVDFPFVNDEEVIGKWEVLGFYDGKKQMTYLGGDRKEIYLLPGGEQYWCYKWTKGKLIILSGGSAFANDYSLEKKGDDQIMIVDLKSFDYEETGEITKVALKKVDSRHYTLKELARKDSIDMPFVEDDRMIGSWEAYDFIPEGRQNKENWNPARKGNRPLFFKKVDFLKGGHVRTVFQDTRAESKNNEKIIWEDDEIQVWTKGYLIRKKDFSACAVEIKIFDGREYLIMEWKSGDYHFGGRDTDYYVFVRA